MASQLTKQDIVRLLPVNDLLYTRTAPSNPVAERTQKRSYAEGGSGTTYTSSDHLIVNLQSGTDFIDPLQSFLVFDVKAEGGDAYVLGSILNLIRDSQISTRSGKEMDRCEHLNILNYHMVKDKPVYYTEYNLQGLIMAEVDHVKATIDGRKGDRNILDSAGYQRVMIPLKFISPIFDSDKLMPPHLARGLRVDCTLEAFATALTDFAAVPTVTGYTIKKPFILTDSYKMADSVLEFLNAEFASKETGLVYEYMSWNTTSTTNTTSDLNVEVRRSVSMAIDAFCVTLDNSKKLALGTDSLASEPIDEGDYSQWRIGSHYLPNTRIEGVVEHYAQYLYWANKLRNEKETAVGFYHFKGDDTVTLPTSVNHGMGKFCVTLQRNNILDLSGVAINNSMTLSIDGNLAAGGTRDIHVFLRHLRRSICFLESTILEV